MSLLGYRGDGEIPTQGWLRWATVGFYVAVAVVVAGLVAALLLG